MQRPRRLGVDLDVVRLLLPGKAGESGGGSHGARNADADQQQIAGAAEFHRSLHDRLVEHIAKSGDHQAKPLFALAPQRSHRSRYWLPSSSMTPAKPAHWYIPPSIFCVLTEDLRHSGDHLISIVRLAVEHRAAPKLVEAQHLFRVTLERASWQAYIPQSYSRQIPVATR